MKIIKELIPYVVIILLVILIRTFIVTPVTVSGDSMDPTLKDKEVLILNKLDKSYKRFDIVVIKYGKERIIKRVIGVPNDNIKYKENKLYVNGQEVKENFKHGTTDDFTLEGITYQQYDKIPNGYYLVLGDNRQRSYDSRMIGLISKKDIVGVARIRLFPFSKIGSI